MNFLKKIYCRLFQKTLYLATFVLDFREPKVYSGAGTLKQVPAILKEKKIDKVLIVTDPGIAKLGLMNGLLSFLAEGKVGYVIYSDTVANPTIDNIEAALLLYKEAKAQGIIAFGGGSPMDCAKGVGMRVAQPHKTISQMRGLLKVGRKLPFLVAIPTTAGTGSETTLAAVVTNALTHEKYAVNDPQLIPRVAILDPMLTMKLPPHITSTTGMDALTHAVEAYIGHSNTKKTRQMALTAVKLIHGNLLQAYNTPEDLKAREAMQIAAYDAGVAFTRAYVGYVHAVAHTLGGMYGLPHGLANAIILPYVLEKFGKKADRRLAELADAIHLTEKNVSSQDKALAFIAWIKTMNGSLGIPPKFVNVIKAKDIPLLAKRAQKEGVPLYPVPRLFSLQDFVDIYYAIQD